MGFNPVTDAPYADLSIKYTDLDLQNKFARQVMLVERERCAKIVKAGIVGDATDPASATFDRDTSLLAAVLNIRGGK